MENMVLNLGREAMPPGFAEDANNPLYRSSNLKPAPLLCEADSRILVPSMLAFAAQQYQTAGLLSDPHHLFLTLDGTPEALRIAQATLRYAAGTKNEYDSVIGIWVDLPENEFDCRLWSQTLHFLCGLSNSPAILFLFVMALNHPSSKRFMEHLSTHIPGLTRSFPWRYDNDQLSNIICRYIRHMGIEIHEPALFESRLKASIAGRITTSEQAVMFGDILARHACLQESGPYINCDVIPHFAKGGIDDYDIPFQ